MKFPLPFLFGRYILRSLIGQGSMGSVYSAELRGPAGFSKLVALKVIRGDRRHQDKERQIQSFVREARLGGLLRHPNIVDVYEFGEVQGQPFLSMEYLQGWTLKQLLARGGAFPVPIALKVASCVCQALEMAHSLRVDGTTVEVIHRDLKPANVMVDRYGQIKVLDFGVATMADQDSPSGVVGTAAYMAPEQILRKPIDRRTDLFSVGVLLYELIAGKRLFADRKIATLLQKRIQVDSELDNPEVWEPIQQRCPGLEAVLRRCVKGSVVERPNTAALLRKKLEALWTMEEYPVTMSSWIEAMPAAFGQSRAGSAEEETGVTLVARQDTFGDPKSQNDRRGTNMSPPHDSFFGRVDVLKQLALLVEKTGGLVTILGPGGIGKSRLCIEFGLERVADFAGGVWLCDLAQCDSTQTMVGEVASTLGVAFKSEHADAHIDRLGHALAGRGRTLLVLDNFEQLVTSSANVIIQWLRLAPQACIVVTSRHRLRVKGEQVIQLSGLSSEASVSMLRTLAGDTGSQSSQESLQKLAELLDGNPLAIALAAWRLEVLSPEQMSERSQEMLTFLSANHNERPARHRALSAVIEQSWRALTPLEQDALTQCAVFGGGFAMEEAEEIVDLSTYPDAPWVVDCLQSLIDKSLLWVRREKGNVRLGMYQSISTFVTQEFARRGEAFCAKIQSRHAEIYGRLGRVELLVTKPSKPINRKILAERVNLTKAMNWSLQHGQQENAEQCVAALTHVYSTWGPYDVGVEQLDRVLRSSSGTYASLTTGLCVVKGRLLMYVGKVEESNVIVRAAMEGAQREMDGAVEVFAMLTMASLCRNTGQLGEALELLNGALGVARQRRDLRAEMVVLGNLGNVYSDLGDYPAARDCFERSIASQSELRNSAPDGRYRGNLASLCLRQGDYARAIALFQEGLGCAHDARARLVEGWLNRQLANVFLNQGRLKTAVVHFERARTVHMELGHRVFEVAILQALGHCRILQGRVKEGTTMIEEALTLCEQVRGQATQVVGLLNLGLQRFCNKEYAMAQESFARALDIAESLHSLRLQAAVLANWGSLYTRVGELDKANALFEQMLSLVEGKDRTLTSQGLSFMAVLHALRGEKKKAQETMTAALELYDFREGLDWLGVMLRKVEVEHRVGRTEAAKASLAEAREAVDSTEVRPGAPLVEELQRIEAIVGGRRSTVP